MSKKKKKSQKVVMKNKNDNFVGTICGNDILLNRRGKVNQGLNPEIRSHTHKTAKDYDRKKEKRKTMKEVQESWSSFYVLT